VLRRTKEQYRCCSGPPDVRIRGFHDAGHLLFPSGCHATPAANAFAATPADKAAEARLKQPDTMPPLQPFDEHFVEVTDTDTN